MTVRTSRQKQAFTSTVNAALHLSDLATQGVASSQVWDSTTLQCLRTLEGHEDNVRVLAYGGRYLFSGSWDKTIRVWDVETLECMRILEGHGEAVLALAVGETFLVSGSYDTTVRFWALDSLRCIRQDPLPSATYCITAIIVCLIQSKDQS